MAKITCFGEVLWDVFPDRKNIGGAPLNVALRLQSFGVKTAIISKIGADENGQNALTHLQDNGVSTKAIQVDKQLETGVVNVQLDRKGSATYKIIYPVAWDKIALTATAIETVKNADAFIFGSLACRDEISKNTLYKLLENASFKVFDVNLRPPFYSFDLLMQLMLKADFIKLNDEELDEICEHLDFFESDLAQKIAFLSKVTHTNIICVTRGGDGTILLKDETIYEHAGYRVAVKDTVGAGDSFLASLVFKLLIQKEIPDKALTFACAVGALVTSKEGANSKISQQEIVQFLSS